MANTTSAKKQIRQQERKRTLNVARKEAFREARKEVRNLLAKETDRDAIMTALGKFYKQVDKAAKENTIHKNTASRYKSRLTSLVNIKLGIS